MATSLAANGSKTNDHAVYPTWEGWQPWALTLIEDAQLVRQVCDVASVALDDASVADFLDRQVDAGVSMARCGRVWLHTHPGDCAQPRTTDEETFSRVFGRTDWAVMFILARGGRNYARLRFHVGPGGDIELPVYTDYTRPFAASNHEAWLAEYQANVESPEVFPLLQPELAAPLAALEDDWLFDWDQLFGERGFLDKKEPSHAV
jgi:hypothetical protein